MAIHPLPENLPTDDLLQLAHRGDNEAFNAIILPWQKPLFAFLYRMAAHKMDAEDLIQETLIRALEELRLSAGHEHVKIWLFGIAACTALEHLAHCRRWRSDAHLIAEQSEDSDPVAQELISEAIAAPGFAFDIREHIAFCFTCIGRSLAPADVALLLLHDIFDFTEIGCSGALGIAEESLPGQLKSVRADMNNSYKSYCKLVTPEGRCNQCRALREGIPKAWRGEDLEKIEADSSQESSDGTQFKMLLRIVREADLENGRSSHYHSLLFDGLSHQEDAHP